MEINGLYETLKTWPLSESGGTDGIGIEGREAVKIAKRIWGLFDEIGYLSECVHTSFVSNFARMGY